MTESYDQHTLRQAAAFEGVGIHTGVVTRVVVRPAAVGAGRLFQIGETTIPAHSDYVVDTRRCTTVGKGEVRVHTVEHLLAALLGCGIDNAAIEVEGPEVPILDGSALPFVAGLRAAGIEAQRAVPRYCRPDCILTVVEGASEIRIEPFDGFRADVTVAFEEWPEGTASCALEVTSDGQAQDFDTRVAPARTFAFRREVEMLLEAGLARGGSVDNALIVSPPNSFSTPLRMPAEWAVHKLLDLIGDLALLNARPQMRVSAVRPGHRINTMAATSLAANGW